MLSSLIATCSIVSCASAPSQLVSSTRDATHRGTAKPRRNTKNTVQNKLDLGETIYTFFRYISKENAAKYEEDVIKDQSLGTCTAKLPHKFWPLFYKDVMRLGSNAMRRRSGVRALKAFLVHRAGGVKTCVALRGGLAALRSEPMGR